MMRSSLGNKVADRLGNRVDIRDDGIFQRRTVGRRRMRAIEPTNGGVKIVEAAVADLGGDFRADAKRPERFVDDQAAGPSCGPSGRSSRCRAAPRCADRSAPRKRLRAARVSQAFKRTLHHQRQGHHGNVLPFAYHGRLAEGDLVILFRHLPLQR